MNTQTTLFLIFPAKKIRARIIAQYIKAAGLRGAVVFGCGNGAAALRSEGVFVLDISEAGDLEARRWWQPAEIALAFPDMFDATSGHLPVWMMIQIAKEFKKHLGNDPTNLPERVPTGSGETITCLRWAYPDKKFCPAYNLDRATKFEANAPLNYLVLQGADQVTN